MNPREIVLAPSRPQAVLAGVAGCPHTIGMSRDSLGAQLEGVSAEAFTSDEEDLVMACCDLDANGRVVRVNRAARHVFGIELGRDAPVMLATYIDAADLSGFYRVLHEVGKDQGAQSLAVAFRPSSGPMFRARLDIDATGDAVKGAHAKLLRVTIVSLTNADPHLQ